MVQGQQNICVQKDKVRPLLHNVHIKDPSVRAKHIKLIEEVVRVKLYHLGLGCDFLHMTPKARATKEK